MKYAGKVAGKRGWMNSRGKKKLETTGIRWKPEDSLQLHNSSCL
jgi:hypothetical protein